MNKKTYKSPIVINSESKMAIPAALISGAVAVAEAAGFVAGAALGAKAVNAVAKAVGDDRLKPFPGIKIVESNT